MKKSFERFYPLFIFLFACLIYANTIPNNYNLDDDLVTINHRTTSKGFDGINEIMNSFYYEDEMGYKYGYRPVTHITFAIEHELFGDNPQIGHAINVLLYALLCLLIFYLTQKLAPDKGPLLALLVTLVFAVHPIHTEVVASIKNRDEILSLLFGVFSFLIFFKVDNKSSFLKKCMFLVLSLAFFAMGLLSKQSIVFFAILIPFAYSCFKENKIVLYPFVFLALGSLIVNWIVGVSYLQISLFFILGFSLLIIHLEVNFKRIIDFFRALFQKRVIQIITVVAIGALWVFAFFFENFGFNIFILFVSTLFIFYHKDSWLSLFVSLFFLFFFTLYGFEIENENIIVSILAMVLLLNQKLLSKNKFIAICLGLGLIMPMHIWNPVFAKETGLVMQYILVVVGFLYFRLLWLPLLIAPSILMVSSAQGWTSYVLVSILFVLYIPFIVLRFKKYPWANKLGKLAVVFVFIGGGIFLSNIAEQTVIDSENTRSILEEIQVTSLEIGNDRPLLKVENPVVEDWSLSNRWSTMTASTMFYFKKLLFPYPLVFYYGYNQIEIHDTFSWQFLLHILIIGILCLALIYFFWKKKFFIVFALGFTILNLVPYSNFFTPVAGIVGERLAFTASYGFSLILGFVFYKFSGIKKKRITILLFSFLILSSVAFVVYRNTLWKNKFDLFSNDIKYVQNSAIANSLLADTYFKKAVDSNNQNDYIEYSERAIDHYNLAIKIYPDLLNWWFLKGEVEFNLGKNKEAISSITRSIEMDATFSYLPYRYLGILYDENEQFSLAIQNYETTLRMEPLQEEVYNNLAICYFKLNQFDNATSVLMLGLENYPNSYDINLNLGKMNATYGNELEALKYYKSARSIKNIDPELTRQIELIEAKASARKLEN